MPYKLASYLLGRTPIGHTLKTHSQQVVAIHPMPSDQIKHQLDAAIRRSPLLARPGFLIRRLHQIHCGLFLDETQGHDVTPVQYSLLTTLSMLGETDQITLAHEIGLERTSVAEVIARLEARGLVLRKQSNQDRRVKLVRLSRKGVYLLKKLEDKVQRAHERTIEMIPEDQRELFVLQLIRLVEANNDVGSAPFKLAVPKERHTESGVRAGKAERAEP
ncbi:MarR family transcriptional regulator [Marinobacter sp. tcs-11]|jgi:DNA-binding MarR family transcriptional regulator|uniref:MarR family winged helix-turn-helix transcriptional regulator n=1 Tax=Marinobacter sp. tcs-11 TaxID=1742860 RepID=UPI002580F214|nr:MarR family transcriptional regulator [Marinobacter sp. tcs-11]